MAGNLRETGACTSCGATNRQRQVAWIVAGALSPDPARPVASVAEAVAGGTGIVYNTESAGALHEVLQSRPGYRCSEFIGPDIASGTVVDGIRHEDLQSLSYDDESVDVVVSSDVFEHVPDPYRAHAEVYRVLRPGGRHIFTVPFHGNGFFDEIRARLVDGTVEHLAPPIYHADPVRPDEGVLVFTIFALEMLLRLREIGFVPYVYKLRSITRGIVGDNAIVFEAVKTDWAWA